MTTTTKKFRAKYPPLEDVNDLLVKFKAKDYTVADLTRAVDLLAKAGIRVDRAELEGLKACLN